MKVSIVLLTYNSSYYLKDLLSSLTSQDFDEDYEVLIIDSGSSDNTLDIIKDFDSIRLIEIPNSEFQHGRTRNFAAQEAQGDFIVYITTSSLPASKQWLKEITQPFDLNPKIVAVYGKHLPRINCNPFVAADVVHAFNWISPNNELLVEYLKDQETFESLPVEERDRRRFYSDANSALRKSYWLEHPYPEVDYAEDQAMGVQVLKTGFKKVYSPTAAVYHSHSYPLKQYFKRKVDEIIALKKRGEIEYKGILHYIAATFFKWKNGLVFLKSSKNYSISQKSLWVFKSLAFALSDQLAIVLVTTQNPNNSKLVKLFSLEREMKKGAK